MKGRCLEECLDDVVDFWGTELYRLMEFVQTRTNWRQRFCVSWTLTDNSHRLVGGMFVTMQLSTSVQQTTEVVALMPAALTMTAASHVPVYLDTPEMDSPVQVI